MAVQRFIIEMGMGVDQRGSDYTKAACRAVKDALSHSSIALFDALGLDAADMQVKVTIGVSDPTAVDQSALKALIPYGQVTIDLRSGGLSPRSGAVIASAAVEAFLDPAIVQAKLS
jgi:uncharacterized protein (TIGR02058 family)